MCALYAVLAVKAEGIRLEEHFDFLVVEDAVLHDFAGTEEGLADNEIDLRGESCQIGCFLAGCIAAANDSNDFLAVEETVASGTGTHTLSHIFLFIAQAQVLCTCTGGDDDAVSGPFASVIEGDKEGTHIEVNLCGHIRQHLGAETFCLSAHIVHQLICIHAFRPSGEVLHFGCDGQLSSGLKSFEQGGREVGATCVDGCGVARRPAAYDKKP